MCTAANSKRGKKRCDVASSSRINTNARKRARYLEKKEINNGREGLLNSGDRAGTQGLSEQARVEDCNSGGAHEDGRNILGHNDSNGNRPKPCLTVAGELLTVRGVHTVPPERKKELRKLGKSTPKLVEIDAEQHAGFFRERISTIANPENNPWHASVYIYPEEEYKEMRLLVSEDGTCGIALKNDGDIVSVFSLKESPHKGSANSMVATAVSLGGKKLDCFDTVLPHIYKQEGFVETERMEWNDEYRPDGWEESRYKAFNNGHPDVVCMALPESMETANGH